MNLICEMSLAYLQARTSQDRHVRVVAGAEAVPSVTKAVDEMRV